MEEEVRRYEYHYETEARFAPAIVRHYFKLRTIPCENNCQSIESQSLQISPLGVLLNESIDSQGNRIQSGSYDVIHDYFRMVSSGVVCCRAYQIEEETPNAYYRFPSVLTQSNASMKSHVSLIIHEADSPFEKAELVMHEVHRLVDYQKGVTNNQTTARDVFDTRKGVCQDFAHLMIALCRCVGLFARYVNGLVLGEGETHAWVEVHDGKRWIGFDPTYDQVIEWGYIKIAHGRDVYDCPSNRGQFFAYTPTQELLTIKCEMKEI